MSFFSHYALFLTETFTLVIAILLTFAGLLALATKDKSGSHLRVTPLNKRFQENKSLLLNTFGKEALKKYKKQLKTQEKIEKRPKLFVLEFIGDIKASAVDNLREEVSAVLAVATSDDEVLITIESGGGTVNSYGFASSQLERFKQHNIPLTVCVDKIAASGGYLMACVANKLYAAPFAIIGSIGVVAQLPNFNRWLKKHDIDYEMLTAGEYKRTLTILGENTDKAREKFNQDLDNIHRIFKEHIAEHRKQVVINEVATGEYWLAKEAFSHKLVDKLITSDEYLHSKEKTHQLIKVQYQAKTNFLAKLIKPVAQTLNNFS